MKGIIFLLIGALVPFESFAFKPIIGFMRKPGCMDASPAPGTVCKGGAIFAGTLSPGATSGSGTNRYMTTPGGCADVPDDGNRGGTNSSNYYTTADFTPTCSGVDSIAKYWNNGTNNYNIPGLTNYADTQGTGYGASNFDTNYGSDNTTIIAAITAPEEGGPHAAARYCDKIVFGGYDDWYLPNRYELNLLYKNRASIPGLDPGTIGSPSYYWSSTENDNYNAWVQQFSNGHPNDGSQFPSSKSYSNSLRLRCVRRS